MAYTMKLDGTKIVKLEVQSPLNKTLTLFFSST